MRSSILRTVDPMTEQVTPGDGNMAGEVEHKIQIEVLGWLTSYVGGDGGGIKYLEAEFSRGETLRAAVFRLSLRYPALHQRMWDSKSGQVGPNLDILLNDAYLGITRSLDSEIQDGDKITMLERSS